MVKSERDWWQSKIPLKDQYLLLPSVVCLLFDSSENVYSISKDYGLLDRKNGQSNSNEENIYGSSTNENGVPHTVMEPARKLSSAE